MAQKPMRSHLRSLRGRLVVLLLLLIAAAIATGVLMVDLFRQSATAQVGEADAEIGRACEAVAESYRFYGAGWQRLAPAFHDPPFPRRLTTAGPPPLPNPPPAHARIWH